MLVTEFQSMVLFFWRKLMNLLRPSITTILQHRTDACSNGWSLACTILYIVKKHPLLIFSKFGRNNPNSYNSKTHVIRANFKSPWGFELYEFNCIFLLKYSKLLWDWNILRNNLKLDWRIIKPFFGITWKFLWIQVLWKLRNNRSIKIIKASPVISQKSRIMSRVNSES